jgi:hypothetical protein
MMHKGARTNNLDLEIKKLLSTLKHHSARMQNYTLNSKVYKVIGSDIETGVPKVNILKKIYSED